MIFLSVVVKMWNLTILSYSLPAHMALTLYSQLAPGNSVRKDGVQNHQLVSRSPEGYLLLSFSVTCNLGWLSHNCFVLGSQLIKWEIDTTCFPHRADLEWITVTGNILDRTDHLFITPSIQVLCLNGKHWNSDVVMFFWSAGCWTLSCSS